MNEPTGSEKYPLVLVHMIETLPTSYSLETAARLAGLHPEMLRHYCRIGLLGETRARTEIEPVFNDDALYELRRLEYYRRQHGLNRRALRLIARLWRENERLRTELRFLREP